MDAEGASAALKRPFEDGTLPPVSSEALPERQGSHQSGSEAETAHNNPGQCAKNSKRSDGQAASQRHIATEQRRRDRINEGFAELQQLLPGKEKVEKAMMLSQAAEYIQQLQGVLRELMSSGAINSLSEELQWQVRVLLPRKSDAKPQPAQAPRSLAPAARLPTALSAVLPNPLQPYLGLVAPAAAPEAGNQLPKDEGVLLSQVQALLQQQQQAAAAQQLQGWQQALQTLQLQQALQGQVVPDLYTQLGLSVNASNPLSALPSLFAPFNASSLPAFSAPAPLAAPVPRSLGSAFVDELPKCGLQQLVDAAACEPSNKSQTAASPHKARKNVKVRRHTTAARIPKPDDAGLPPRAGPGRPSHV